MYLPQTSKIEPYKIKLKTPGNLEYLRLLQSCTSPFVTGVTGKPRIQRPGEFANTAATDKKKLRKWDFL
jgi:hypothetical protein